MKTKVHLWTKSEAWPFIVAVIVRLFPVAVLLGTPSYLEADGNFGFTYHRADGNRFISGRGRLPKVASRDFQLQGLPVWIVAAPLEEGSIWIVALEDGRLHAVHAAEGRFIPVPLKPQRLPSRMPPLLEVRDDDAAIVYAPDPRYSLLSHPVVLPRSGITVSLYGDGRLALNNDNRWVFDFDALPDSRILYDETERLLLLTHKSEAYRHGVLGDAVEATGVTLVRTQPVPEVKNIIMLKRGRVIEGIAPIWSDMNNDGKREIVLTVSDARKGARFVIFNEEGDIIGAGPPVGKGYRWRHQIAIAPFGPQGEIELVGVLTPHIGGVVEFYRLEENSLVMTAHIAGYSSHVIGSRNLDMAAAADFDGDGRIELLIPSQSRERLGAIRHTPAGALAVWSIPLGGTMSTNLAAVTMKDGMIAVGIGREDGVLRLWIP